MQTFLQEGIRDKRNKLRVRMCHEFQHLAQQESRNNLNK